MGTAALPTCRCASLIHPDPKPSSSVLLLALAASFVLTGALTGCETSDGEYTALPGPDSVAVVTYAFELPVGSASTAPSSALVADLVRDPHLGRFSISDGSEENVRVRELDAEFVFGTVEAFLAWRDRAQIVALIDSVAALAPDTVAFTPRLTVRRPSLYRSVVGRVVADDGLGGRSVESVTCNDDCSRIDIAYRTRGNEAGASGGQSAGGGQGGGSGTGDAGDIDAVTLICQPGLASTIETCKTSN